MTCRGDPPELLWSKTYPGISPGLYLTSHHVLFQYAAIECTPPACPTKLLCLDHAGELLWEREGLFSLGGLRGDDALADTPTRDSLQVLDGTGSTVAAWHGPSASGVVRHGDRLVMVSKEHEVIVTTLRLEPISRFRWPGKRGPSVGCLVNERFHWIEGNEIWRCDLAGRAEKFTEIPLDLVEQAMADHERETGLPAMQGWSVTLPPGETDFASYITGKKGTPQPFQLGARPPSFEWWMTYDPEARALSLSNMGMPHLILCIDDEDASPRWCRYINHACCGGNGYRLPGGLLVASSGCGGVLTWFDDEGHILFRSEPHEGVGLATAYTNDVTPLSSGLALVSGGPGLVAYDRGELVWAVETGMSHYSVSENEELLLSCDWQNPTNPAERSVRLIARGL